MFFERLVVSDLWLHNGPVCIGGGICMRVGGECVNLRMYVRVSVSSERLARDIAHSAVAKLLSNTEFKKQNHFIVSLCFGYFQFWDTESKAG